MSTPIPLAMLWAIRDDRELSPIEQRVACMLVAHCDSDGSCYPSVRKLAREARTSPGAVRRALNRIESGFGPLVLSVSRGQRLEDGTSASHKYSLSVRGGRDHTDPVRDQAYPTTGSHRPQGGDHTDPGTGSPVPPKKDIEEGHKKKDTEEHLSTEADDHVLRVFRFWQKDTGHVKAKLDRKRQTRIKRRLKEGFTCDELEAAIRNRRNDPFLMGEPPSPRVFDGLETLLRDVAQVERLRDLTTPQRKRGSQTVQRGGFDVTAATDSSWLEKPAA